MKLAIWLLIVLSAMLLTAVIVVITYRPEPQRVVVERQVVSQADRKQIAALEKTVVDLSTRLGVMESRPPGLSGPEVRDLIEQVLPEVTTTLPPKTTTPPPTFYPTTTTTCVERRRQPCP